MFRRARPTKPFMEAPRAGSTISRVRPSRVLMIEDNVTLLDLYTLVLEEEHEVLRATRGEEGYEIARERRPDAIVVDVMLPDLDGLQLCDRLRDTKELSSTPLVVLTGDDAAHARASIARHLDAVLKKPCSGDDLLHTLRRALAVRAIR